jgi:hypothetical protein
MATYSRTNGWLGAGIAVLCGVVFVLDALAGNVPMAALFGFLALFLGLQAMDDLVWQGSQARVVGPLRRVVGLVTVLCVLWVTIELLL